MLAADEILETLTEHTHTHTHTHTHIPPPTHTYTHTNIGAYPNVGTRRDTGDPNGVYKALLPRDPLPIPGQAVLSHRVCRRRFHYRAIPDLPVQQICEKRPTYMEKDLYS